MAFGVTLAPSGASADQFGVATYDHNPNHGGLIAAHLTLPFGTRVRVYNLDNGRNVVVTIVADGAVSAFRPVWPDSAGPRPTS